MATLRETFQEIADAIRAKGVSGTFTPVEMASKIGEISGGGGGTKYGVSVDELFGDVDANGVYQNTTEPLKFNGVGIKEINLSVDSFANKFAYNNAIVEFNMPDLETLSGNGYYTNGCCAQTCMNSSVVKASMPKLQSVSNYSCYQMFRDCKSLTQAPELPATTLGDNCYEAMFYGCTSLTKAPDIPAINVRERSCIQMFANCTSLTQAPELPATTLTFYSYSGMFQNCTSLEQAPYLPAINVCWYCYQNMFNNCSSLKRIKMDASSGSWGNYMFEGCTAIELVDMTGSTGVPQLTSTNNFDNTNATYKIVVPDSLYDTWIAATNWSSASIQPHIMKQSDWNAEHPDDILP